MLGRLTFLQVVPVRPFADVSHWVKDKVHALRNDSATDIQIKHLRGLDHHMLRDMGIDQAALYDPSPKIEKISY